MAKSRELGQDAHEIADFIAGLSFSKGEDDL